MGRKSSSAALSRRLGGRLRALRRYFGWREEMLAVLLQMSAARIRAYENGSKRIPATRLVEFCALLEVPVTYFFSDLDIAAFMGPGQRGHGLRVHRMAVELLRTFVKLPSEQQRDLLEMAKRLPQRRGPGERRRASDG